MRITEDIIQKVKEKTDIVDIISETVKLKKSGNNFTGLCPFHNEKSPSFMVSPARQSYKCFGCGEAGNVFTFIMKTKNLPFLDVVKILAEKASVTIEESTAEEKIKRDHKEKLFKINVEAARFFFNNLKTDKTALGYFKNRGITESSIRKFGLGFSKDSFNSLLYFLKQKGYTELDLINAGLIKKSEKKDIYYDRFRNRVMFPVFDYLGKVIGFGGRVLDDSKPKYLNSPETILFNKGINLYGLNFAIKDNKDRTIIIVEGYMDCIALHQNGITNVVASLGTALTINQAKLLKRYADKIIISYDADLAGQNATMKGLEVLRNESFDVRILKVPQGKDPDEYIRNYGKDAFLRLIENALPLTDYKILRATEGINFSDQEKVIQYVGKITDILIDLNPVEKDVYIKKVAEQTGVKEQAIYDQINGVMHKGNLKSQEQNNSETVLQKSFLEPAYIKAERYLLKLLLTDIDNRALVTNSILVEDFVLKAHQKLFNIITEELLKNDSNTSIEKRIEVRCNDIESSKEFIEIIEYEILQGDFEISKLVSDCIREIKKFKLEENKRLLMAKIKECESNGFMEESVKLAQQLMKIQMEIGRLQL